MDENKRNGYARLKVTVRFGNVYGPPETFFQQFWTVPKNALAT